MILFALKEHVLLRLTTFGCVSQNLNPGHLPYERLKLNPTPYDYVLRLLRFEPRSMPWETWVESPWGVRGKMLS